MALQWLTFIQYRISMAFLLAFVLLFTPLRYDRKRSLCITALCFVLTGLMDLYLTTIAQSGLAGAVVLLLEIPITQLTALWLCRYRDFRALFTGFSAAAYVLVGNFFLSLVHYLTNSDLMAISVQVIIHGLMLFYLIKKLRFNYLEAMKESKYSWGWFCLFARPHLCHHLLQRHLAGGSVRGARSGPSRRAGAGAGDDLLRAGLPAFHPSA
jgi:hypothetical protein